MMLEKQGVWGLMLVFELGAGWLGVLGRPRRVRKCRRFMRQLRQDRSHQWALCRLKTIGEACRAMLDETLRATLTWVVQQVREHEKDHNYVLARLRLA
jgi:hypothetical protein